jgi:SPP1 family predicted phage head-tail adaptor
VPFSLNLPHVVTIERRSVAQDPDTGQETETWATLSGFAKIPAEVLPGRAAEFFAAAQVQSTGDAMIRIWYQPGLDTKMRVVHHVRPGIDEYYDVVGLVPFQYQQRELRIMALRRDAEGFRRGTDLVNA